MRKIEAIFFSLVVIGCQSDHFQDLPFVQESAKESPRWTVDINRVLDGVFRTYRPRCFDTVKTGHTVEFRNFMPDIPANVSSLSGPDTLFSPNLVTPYNYVARDDPANSLCEINAEDGSCAKRPHWSYWRYTFEYPGVYAWIDTNSSTPGQQVVDPYYGTVTYIGIDPNSPIGTICVLEADGFGCDGVCCANDDDCEDGKLCFIAVTDAVGTCLTPSG